MTMLEIDALGMYDSAAEALGKTFVTTELNGGGTATPPSVAIARRGVANVLRHAGILAGEPDREVPSNELDMPSAEWFIYSEAAGMVEPGDG